MAKVQCSLDGRNWDLECCNIETPYSSSEYIAEQYAKHVFYHHDGWDCDGGFEVWLKSPGSGVMHFDIQIESVPSFSATRRD
jgi:hypothetical protein